MSFRNSLKLLTSSFNVVWKHLVYVLISFAASVGLVFAFAGPLIECLEVSGWIGHTTSVLKSIYTEPAIVIFDTVRETIFSFFGVLYQNFGHIWFSIIGLVFAGYFIPSFMYGVGMYNVASVTQKRMTSLLNASYAQNFVSNLRPAIKYGLVRMIVKFPFDVIKLVLVVVLFRLSTTIFTSLLFFSLLSLAIVLISSLEITVFAGFAPYMVDNGGNPFKCFAKGLVPVFKNFMKTYGSAVVLSLFIVFANSFIGLFTVFSGLLITLPATIVIVAIFSNVVYLTATQNRYYLSESIIVNPVNDENVFNDSNKNDL